MENSIKHNHPAFKKAFSEQKELIRFLAKELTETVKNNSFIEIRNAIAHGEQEKVTIKDAIAVRNIILGVGCPGLITQCYYLMDKEKYRHYFEVTEFEQSAQNKNKLKLVS